MDRLIYTAMTGASHTMQQQAAVAQNLANINTPGFRSTIDAFRSVPLVGEGLPLWFVYLRDGDAGQRLHGIVVHPFSHPLFRHGPAQFLGLGEP